jgi:O-antigen/teichoic acid export membrane protein
LNVQLDIKSGLKNILPILISLAGSGFLAFLTQVLLGHSLTVEDFGIVSTAVSIIVIITAVIGFGIPSVWLLIFGQEGWQAFRWVRQSLKFMLLWGPFVLAISWAGCIWLIDDARLLTTIWWMQAMIVMQVMVELLTAKLQLEARYKALSLWQVLPHLGRLCVATAVYFSATSSVDLVAKGFSVISLVLIAASGFGLSSMSSSKMRLAGHQQTSSAARETPLKSPSYRGLLSLAWPYAGAAALVMLYGRIEIVLLGNITSQTAAGTFTVAVSFLLVAFLVPHAIYQMFLLPKIHRWFHSEWQKFLSVYRFGCAAMTLMGAAGIIGTYFLGELLVVSFFGEKYRESGQILSLLSVCILFRFVSTSIGSSLVSGNYMKYKVYCQSFTTLISVPCAFVLITLYGIDGAIINKILTEFILLISYMYASARYVLGSETWSGWSLKVNYNA